MNVESALHVCTMTSRVTCLLIICAVCAANTNEEMKVNKLVKLTFGDVGSRSTHPFHASLRYVVYSSKNFIVHRCSAVIISPRFLITIGKCLRDHLRWKNQPNLVLRYVAIVGEEKHHLTYLPDHLAYEFTYTKPYDSRGGARGSEWDAIFPLRLTEQLDLDDKVQPIKMANRVETEYYMKNGTVLTAYSIGIINSSKTFALMGSRVQRTRVIVDQDIPCEKGHICTRSTTIIESLTSEDLGSALVVRRKSKKHLLIGLMRSGNIIFGVSKWILVHPFAEKLMSIAAECA